MKKYLTSKIRELSERLLDIDRDKIAVTAQLRAYEDMLQHVVDDSSEPPESVKPSSKAASPTAFEMSKDWLNVMRDLCNRGKSFTAADMVDVARGIGFQTKTTNARSQLAFYDKKKYVRRISRGVYAITADGKTVFRNAEGSAAIPADPAKSSGEVAASIGNGG